MAEVLAKQPRPKGPRLAIVTNGRRSGRPRCRRVAFEWRTAGQLSAESMEALNQLLPPHWSQQQSPSMSLATRFRIATAKVIEIAAHDPNIDGLLAITCPQGMAAPSATAEHLKPYAPLDPASPCWRVWMGGAGRGSGRRHPEPGRHPDVSISRYRRARVLLHVALQPTPCAGCTKRLCSAEKMLQGRTAHRSARSSTTHSANGRTLLTEEESKQLLAAYGLPTVPTTIAKTEDEAGEASSGTGYPIVLKLLSETITHKTEVGGYS